MATSRRPRGMPSAWVQCQGCNIIGKPGAPHLHRAVGGVAHTTSDGDERNRPEGYRRSVGASGGASGGVGKGAAAQWVPSGGSNVSEAERDHNVVGNGSGTVTPWRVGAWTCDWDMDGGRTCWHARGRSPVSRPSSRNPSGAWPSAIHALGGGTAGWDERGERM